MVLRDFARSAVWSPAYVAAADAGFAMASVGTMGGSSSSLGSLTLKNVKDLTA